MTIKNDDALTRSGELDGAPSPQPASTTEKAATFTSGPWEIGSDFVGPLKVMTVKDRQVVAHVGASSFVCAEANARLIAASPELADALAGMVGLIQLIQSREPALVTNHRFIEAQRVLAKVGR